LGFIVASSRDPASVNIKQALLDGYGFRQLDESVDGLPVWVGDGVRLVTVDRELIRSDGLDSEIGADFLIFISKHRSKAGLPSLLVHPVGNWGEAVLGGSPRALSPTSATRIRAALLGLKEEGQLLESRGWQIGLEVTHHGPLTDVPTLFVEVGSTEAQWADREAAKAGATAAMAAAKVSARVPTAVGFGGPHYAPKFTSLVLSRDLAVGHIAPGYAFPLGPALVEQAVEKTEGNPKLAMIDWKGLKGSHREALVKVLRRLGLEVVRV